MLPLSIRATPGYHAVSVADPDGMKLEVVCEPARGASRTGAQAAGCHANRPPASITMNPSASREVDELSAVALGPEAHTRVWRNGVDFEPATRHDWLEDEAAMVALARRWASRKAR